MNSFQIHVFDIFTFHSALLFCSKEIGVALSTVQSTRDVPTNKESYYNIIMSSKANNIFLYKS